MLEDNEGSRILRFFVRLVRWSGVIEGLVWSIVLSGSFVMFFFFLVVY